MKRGDLVTIAMAGDFGKPRPALVVQADQFAANQNGEHSTHQRVDNRRPDHVTGNRHRTEAQRP